MQPPGVIKGSDLRLIAAAYFSRMARSSDTLISVGEHFNPNQVLKKWTFDKRKITSERLECMDVIKDVFY